MNIPQFFRLNLNHTGNFREIDCINEIGADAIQEARAALCSLDELPNEYLQPIKEPIEKLKDAMANRNLFNDEFQAVADRICGALPHLDDAHPLQSTIGSVQRNLDIACRFSNRVLDLVATEKIIKRAHDIDR